MKLKNKKLVRPIKKKFYETKQWYSGRRTRTETKKLIMTVALRLPPWGRACEMEINISPDVDDFDKVKKVIACISRHHLPSSSDSAPVTAAAKSFGAMMRGVGDAHGCNASAAAPATAEEDRAHHPLFETKTTDEADDTGASAAAIATADMGDDIGVAAIAIATATPENDNDDNDDEEDEEDDDDANNTLVSQCSL